MAARSRSWSRAFYSRRRFRVVVSLFAIAFGGPACASIFGFDRLSEEGAPIPNEAGPDVIIANDTGVDSGPFGDAGDPCSALGTLDPPVDAGAGSVPAILGALRILDFGLDVDAGGRPQIPGYNLDKRCSVDVNSSSCKTSLLEITFETHSKDKNAFGLDNAGFSLIEYITRFSDVLSAKSINDGISNGLYGGVFRVDQWNGQPDDDSVTVEIFPALAFDKNGDGGSKPKFDEDDEWILDKRYQVGGVLEASLLKSDRAYVVNNRVVARFKSVVVPISIADDPKLFDIKISDAVVSATIGTDLHGKTAIVDGVVGGRWKSSDFLGEVRTIYLEDSNGLKKTVLCDKVSGATLIYNSVKSTICDGRDIRSDSQDNVNMPCDAVSTGARIETYSIKTLGDFQAPVDAGVRCANPAIPAGDDCPPN